MKVQAIIPAAGLGKRFGAQLPKSLIDFGGKPLIVHSLQIFSRCALVGSIILVVPAAFEREFQAVVKKWKLNKVCRIVTGGATRSASVYRGLCASDDDTQILVVHDAARPLVSGDLITRCIKTCQRYGAVVAAVPVKSTIKRVSLKTATVLETLKRKELWEIQTPQVFKRSLLCEAYQKARRQNVTDCASLIEQIGKKVKVVMGDYKNIKVTTKEDLSIVKILAR